MTKRIEYTASYHFGKLNYMAVVSEQSESGRWTVLNVFTFPARQKKVVNSVIKEAYGIELGKTPNPANTKAESLNGCSYHYA